MNCLFSQIAPKFENFELSWDAFLQSIKPWKTLGSQIVVAYWWEASSIIIDLFQNSFITECTIPLGMESRWISDAQITASSQLDGKHSAVQGRLHFQTVGNNAGGWSALTSDANQWLQVDFGSYTHVTQVATQGVNGVDEWVTRYKLQYSDNGVMYEFYQKTGNTSVTVWFILI